MAQNLFTMESALLRFIPGTATMTILLCRWLVILVSTGVVVVVAQQMNPVLILNTRQQQQQPISLTTAANDNGDEEVLWDTATASFSGNSATVENFPVSDTPNDPNGNYRFFFFDMGIPGYTCDVMMQYFHHDTYIDGGPFIDRYYIDLPSGEPTELGWYDHYNSKDILEVINITSISAGSVLDFPTRTPTTEESNTDNQASTLSMPYTFQYGGIIIEIPTGSQLFEKFASQDFAMFKIFYGYNENALDGATPAITVYSTQLQKKEEEEGDEDVTEQQESLQNQAAKQFQKGNVFLTLDDFPSNGKRIIVSDFPNWKMGAILFHYRSLATADEASTVFVVGEGASGDLMERYYIELPEGEPAVASVHASGYYLNSTFVSVTTVPAGTVVNVTNPSGINTILPFNMTRGGILVEIETSAAMKSLSDSAEDSNNIRSLIFYSYDAELQVGCPLYCSDGSNTSISSTDITTTKMEFPLKPIPESFIGFPFLDNCESIEILLQYTPSTSCAQMKADFNILPLDLRGYCGCSGKKQHICILMCIELTEVLMECSFYDSSGFASPNICGPLCEEEVGSSSSRSSRNTTFMNTQLIIHDGPFAPLTCSDAVDVIASSTDPQTCTGFKLAASETCCNNGSHQSDDWTTNATSTSNGKSSPSSFSIASTLCSFFSLLLV